MDTKKTAQNLITKIEHWSRKIESFKERWTQRRLQWDMHHGKFKNKNNFTDYRLTEIYERAPFLYSDRAMLNQYEIDNSSPSSKRKAADHAKSVAKKTLQFAKEFYARGFDIHSILTEKDTSRIYPFPAKGFVDMSPRVADFRYLNELLENNSLKEFNILIDSISSISHNCTYCMSIERKPEEHEVPRNYKNLAPALQDHHYAFTGFEDVSSVRLDAAVQDIRIFAHVGKDYDARYWRVYGNGNPFIDLKDIFDKQVMQKRE